MYAGNCLVCLRLFRKMVDIYRFVFSASQVHNTTRNNGSNDSNSGYPNHHNTSSLTKVRGPPPQPPGPPPKLINGRVRILYFRLGDMRNEDGNE